MPKYLVAINRCDNRLVVSMNGATLWDGTYDNDPPIGKTIDITDKLQPHPYPNVIRFVGYNSPKVRPDQHNPWRFEYRIYKDSAIDVAVEVSSKGASAPAGQVHDASHTLVKEPTAKSSDWRVTSDPSVTFGNP